MYPPDDHRARSRSSRASGTPTAGSTPDRIVPPRPGRRRSPGVAVRPTLRLGPRSPSRTTAAASPRPPAAASGVGKCVTGARRGDVPELPGHGRGAALHAGPRPAAVRDGDRRGGHRTAGGPTRSATRSTCACRARAASATARSGSTWPPTRPSSCTSTTRAGCGRPPTTRWAGCPCGCGWSAAAGAGGQRADAAARARWRLANGWAGSRRSGAIPRFARRRSRRGRVRTRRRAVPPAGRGPRRPALAGHLHRPLRPRVAAAPSPVIEARVAVVLPPRPLLRADLDHDRQLAPPGACWAGACGRSPRRAAGRARRRAGAALHRRPALRRARAAPRRPARRRRRRVRLRRGAAEHAGALAPAASRPGSGARPGALPPARGAGLEADRPCMAAPGIEAECSTPAAAASPATSASSGATTRCRWPAPSGYCCPRCAPPPRTSRCSPTASAAAPSSRQAGTREPVHLARLAVRALGL